MVSSILLLGSGASPAGVPEFRQALAMEEVMFRNLAIAVGYAVVLVLFTATSVPAAQFGTEEEAKAMLERAVPR